VLFFFIYTIESNYNEMTKNYDMKDFKYRSCFLLGIYQHFNEKNFQQQNILTNRIRFDIFVPFFPISMNMNATIQFNLVSIARLSVKLF
jgi:hypothetical protein